MQELYIKSIIALKQYDNKPSVKEWNRIAQHYNLMSTKTMCFISNLSWSALCNKIRK